ncbi:LLM class flavin-dependent oxidoreductase [Streptomyces sp. RKAG337]|uniref:LLM class flavin-dependent oxidoreductase n=1 Tax=Streptomyces sp. RKAG337 TaxID=2893404 RepID=UPI002034261C|nr:LLM class flavin-dependent oxidoreductase [Streptomyces sp. RKAG337]MCM2430346.1 LLM class flavin-dependent oxidoreductase [Streptomyces sp. RKAG337]
MNIGLGLPVDDPGRLLSWARRADAGPFTTLGLLDRLVHDNPEPLITLAALAGATHRIRVQTEVLLAPLHRTALLAKQTATLDRLSGGRFTLGIGIGGREDDYLATGVDVHRRGRRLDEQMAVLRRLWAGEPYGDGVGPIGPAPATPGGPEVLFGGFTPAALARAARWGDGFLGAAPSPHFTDRLFRQAEQAWRDAGRTSAPRLVAQVNVAIGPDAVVAEARENVARYYAFLGDATHFADGLLGDPQEIKAAVSAYADLGADEVILYCWSPDPDQIDRFTDTLF